MKFFSLSEFDCKHTGENQMQSSFLKRIDDLRSECGFPFVITSGYRSPSHPIEAAKKVPGTHSQGIACDIRIRDSAQRYILLKKAFEHGFTGVGVAKTFIHLDTRPTTAAVWTYT